MGGAIFNAAGSITITDSTLAGNAALGGAGYVGAGNGSGYGGALFNLNGRLTITNSTLASNTGGALYTLGMDGVLASAVAGQTATVGTAAGAQATFINTIFANSSGGPDLVNNNSTVSGSNNLATQSTNLPTGVSATTTAALDLGPLANNGGPTPTMALLPGSSAIDAGLDTTQAPYNLTTDQRGTGFSRQFGKVVDVGAFEFTAYYYTVTTLGEGAGTLTTAGHAGSAADSFQDTTLRGAIAAATADHGFDTIGFDPSLFTSVPQTITLITAGDNTFGPSDFGIRTPITIVGPTGNNGLTLANSTSVSQRLFYVGATGSLTLEDLTLSGGTAQGGSSDQGGGAAGMGGAIFNQGILTVLQSTLSGNTASGGSGGVGSTRGGGGVGGPGDSSGNGGGPNGGGVGGDFGHGLGGGFGGGGELGFAYASALYPGGSGGFGGGGGSGTESAVHGGVGGSGGFGGGGGGSGGGGTGGSGGFGGGAGRSASGGGAYAGGGGAGMGGAIFNAAGTVTITNSTLAGNTAQGGAGGFFAGNGSGYGGAVFNLNGSLTITNSTLASNTVAAGSGAGAFASAAGGGALYTLGMNGVLASAVAGQTATIGKAAGAQATFINTLFANSSGGPDIVNNNSAVSGSNNLATQSTSLPTGVTATTTALLDLGPLANNGGPTQTMALTSTASPAFGAGVAVPGITADQAGNTRNNPPTIGAFELVTSSFSNLSAPTIAYGTATTTFSGDLGASAPFPTGDVTITLNGVLQTATLNSDGSFSASFDTHALAVTSGGYTISFAYAGDSTYTTATASSTLTVTAATPTVSVSDAGGTYNQSPFAATTTVAGVNGIAGSSLENVTPTLTYYPGTKTSGTPLSGAPLLPGTYTVKASFAGSTDYTSASATTTFTIKRPTISITGPTLGVPGQPLTYSFAVNGPTQGITFSVNYGDGTSLTTSAGGPSLKLDHLYTATGHFTIQVTATDTNGVVSRLAMQRVRISTVALEVDPSGGTALAVGGNAAGGDTITVKATDTTGKTVRVTVNSLSFGPFTPTGHILVYGQGGNDKITLKPYVVGTTRYFIQVPALLYGEGSGGDQISAAGSAANNVLTGHGSNEFLTAGHGRDLLIGGTGAATLDADFADAILIGGWTNYDISSSGMTYDQKLAALEAIMAEWGSTDSYATRVSALAGSLNTSTVHDNSQNGTAVEDQLEGHTQANDWFFAGLNDHVTGKNAKDVITTII
jgi:hypothetical protein